MNKAEKQKYRLNYMTKATIRALKAHQRNHPGECIVKDKLYPRIIPIAESIYGADDFLFDSCIGLPNESFIDDNWGDMVLLAAEKYEDYIIGIPFKGVRLGTFEEYCNTRGQKAKIMKGIFKGVKQQNRVVTKQGGQDFPIDLKIPQLGDGSED